MTRIIPVPLVGERRSEVLRGAGYRTISDIKKASVDEISSLPGFSRLIAGKIKKYAEMVPEDATPQTELVPMEEECPRCGAIVSKLEHRCHSCGEQLKRVENEEEYESLLDEYCNLYVEIIKNPTSVDLWRRITDVLERMGEHSLAFETSLKADALELNSIEEAPSPPEERQPPEEKAPPQRPPAVSGVSLQRGIINGNGLINGNGIRRPSPGLRRRLPIRAGVVIFAAVLLLAALSAVLTVVYAPPVNIDGDFSDWWESPAYRTHFQPVPELKTLPYGSVTYFEAYMTGSTAIIFIDSDGSSETGYPVRGTGADYMVRISDGKVQLYEYHSEIAGDWRGWTHVSSLESASDGKRVEFALSSRYVGENAMVVPFADGEPGIPIGLFKPVVWSEVRSVSTRVAGEAKIAEVKMYNTYMQPLSIKSFSIQNLGSGGSVQLRIQKENVVLSEGIAGETLTLAKAIELETMLEVSVFYVGGGLTERSVVPVLSQTPEIRFLSSFEGPGTYIGRLPPTPIVDNATAEWSQFDIKSDAEGDAPESVDIVEFSAVSNTTSYFYVRSLGELMRSHIVPVSTTGPRDSDRDTIPDSDDPYPNDFDNNGIPDSEQYVVVSGARQPDADGDGVADYPYGPDEVLNTTIPEDPAIPQQYWGRVVRVSLKSPVKPLIVGDYIDIYVSGERGTPVGGITADTMIRVVGVGGKVVEKSVYVWSDGSWTRTDTAVTVAKVSDRMEMSVDLDLTGRDVFIRAYTYTGEGDDAGSGAISTRVAPLALPTFLEKYGYGETASERFAYNITGLADLNGDGFDDFAVGAPYKDLTFVYFGSSNFFLRDYLNASLADLIIPGDSGSHFGHSLSDAGDVNGDGYPDFLVGAPEYDGGRGRAWIFYGAEFYGFENFSAGSSLNDPTWNTDTGLSTTVVNTQSQAGLNSVKVDDPDSTTSGYVWRAYQSQLTKGVFSFSVMPDAGLQGNGGTYYFDINLKTGASSSGTTGFTVYFGTDGTIYYDAGATVTALTTFSLGTWYRFYIAFDCSAGTYDIYLLDGTGVLASSTGNSFRNTITYVDTVAFYTYSSAAGSFYFDCVYLAPYPHIIDGSPTNATGKFGWSVAGGGKVDGTYYTIAVGAPYANGTDAFSSFSTWYTYSGAVYLFYADGSIPTVADNADRILSGYYSFANFSHDIELHDMNGDGYADLVVGEPTWDGDMGRVYVYLGGPGGIQNTTIGKALNPDSGYLIDTFSATEMIAQSFTPEVSCYLESVVLPVRDYSDTGDPSHFKVYIQTDSGGLPSGTTISSIEQKDVSDGGVSAYYTWVRIRFTVKPYLQAGNRYWIVVEPTETDGYYVAYKQADVYAGGYMATYSSSTGTWSASSTYDVTFIAYSFADDVFMGYRLNERFGTSLDCGSLISARDVVVGAPYYYSSAGRVDVFGGLYNNTVYSVGTYKPGYILTVTDTVWEAQSFTTDHSTRIMTIWTYMIERTANPTPLTIRITTDAAGAPDLNNVLYTITAQPFSDPTSIEGPLWIVWYMNGTDGVPIQANQKYWIVFNASDIDGYGIYFNSYDPYPAWEQTASTDSGATWTSTTNELRLQIVTMSNISIKKTAAGTLFGFSVAIMPDIDAGGKGELVVGAPGNNSNAGAVYIFSGEGLALGTLDYVIFDGAQTGMMLGFSVAYIGDVDGDGNPDIAMGAPYYDVATTSDAGLLEVAYVPEGLTAAVVLLLFAGLALMRRREEDS